MKTLTRGCSLAILNFSQENVNVRGPVPQRGGRPEVDNLADSKYVPHADHAATCKQKKSQCLNHLTDF